MFVELDHSVVFLLYSAMYLFPLVQKDCIYWSFEDEVELHTLCKDSQIAKRGKEKGKRECGVGKVNRVFQCCVFALKVRPGNVFPPFTYTKLVIVYLL